MHEHMQILLVSVGKTWTAVIDGLTEMTQCVQHVRPHHHAHAHACMHMHAHSGIYTPFQCTYISVHQGTTFNWIRVHRLLDSITISLLRQKWKSTQLAKYDIGECVSALALHEVQARDHPCVLREPHSCHELKEQECHTLQLRMANPNLVQRKLPLM